MKKKDGKAVPEGEDEGHRRPDGMTAEPGNFPAEKSRGLDYRQCHGNEGDVHDLPFCIGLSLGIETERGCRCRH
jgi:hypothetical protein